MITTSSGAPTTYEELERHYRGFVEKLVSKGGIASQDVEDVASDILLVFMKRGALDWYDPDKIHDTPRGKKTARFASFLAGFVNLYLRSHRDKQKQKLQREPVRLEQPLLYENSSWGEANSPTVELFTDAEVEDWIVEAYKFLQQNAQEKELDEIFRRTMEMIWTTGKVSRRQLAKDLGVSDSVICRRYSQMKEVLIENGWRDSLAAVG